MIDIRDTTGSIRHSVSVSEKAVYKKELMKEEYILLTFSVDQIIDFQKGDYIEIEQGRFEITDLKFPVRNTETGGFDYELRFDSIVATWASRILFYDRQGNKEKAWSLTRQPQYFLDIVVSNLQTAFGKIYIGVIGDDIEDAPKAISFDSRSIFDALTDIAEAWNTEWYVDGNAIYLGRCEMGTEITLDSSVVAEMSRQSGDSSKYATRLYAFGSTRNIPANYRPIVEGTVVEGIVEKRLMLPLGTDHVDAWPDMRSEDVVEAVVAFDEVYPKRLGTITQVTPVLRNESIENADGTTTQKQWIAYRIADSGLVFSDKYVLAGQELKIVFQSGPLNGMEFAVQFNPDGKSELLADGSGNPEAQLFEIVRSEDYGAPLPNEVLKPSIDNTYILFGYDVALVSDLLIPDAERELLRVATDYLAKNSIDPSVYNCRMRSIRSAGYSNGVHSEQRELDFEVGQRVKLSNPVYFTDGRSSRIYGYEKRLDNKYEATYLVGESSSYSRLNSIEGQIQEITYKGKTFVGTGNGGIYLITKYDKTKSSDHNAYSSLRADTEFLSKKHKDTAEGCITFKKGVISNGFSTEEFAGGPTGVGARIDQKGHGELHSLVLRMFLETPELRKNKISVVGDEFWVTAAGLIESVQKASTLPVYTKSGRQIMGKNGKPWMLNVGKGYVMRFKLEEGEVHTFKKDDILVSKFDQPDGFQTAWYRVKYVLTDREVFVSALNDYAPQVAMSVARQGNFTNPERQNSIYIDGRNGYMRVLSGVNDTEIRFENIRCQYGNLNGLTVPGIGSLHGYGEYSDNAFKKGVFLMQGGTTVEDFVKDAISSLQGSLGGLAFQDKVEKALLGNTIISGGFIDTSLINVDTLVAQTALVDRLVANEAFIDKLVARAISTQQGDNPQRVEIKKGEDAVRVYDKHGRNVISMTTDAGLPLLRMDYVEFQTVLDIFKIQQRLGNVASTLNRDGLLITNGDQVEISLDRNAGLTLPAGSKVNIGRGSSINMPGVLAAGRALKGGGFGFKWGYKSGGLGLGIKVGGIAGKYRINHGLGHTDYTTTVTAAGAYTNWEVTPVIVAETANYVEVWMLDNSVPREVDFNFTIIGDNK